MNECQSIDHWTVNYEAEQQHKQQQFLKAIKHEFIPCTEQQQRDRLNPIKPSP